MQIDFRRRVVEVYRDGLLRGPYIIKSEDLDVGRVDDLLRELEEGIEAVIQDVVVAESTDELPKLSERSPRPARRSLSRRRVLV